MVICLKREKVSVYTKCIFSSLIILFTFAVMTVFPNLWDNFAVTLNPIVFKTIPFMVFSVCGIIIFSLYEGISFLFYRERRKGGNVSFRTFFRFLSPKSFFNKVRFYTTLYSIKLLLFLAIYIPSIIISFIAALFYSNNCPFVSTGIMSACAIVSLIISFRFYSEITAVFFLSKYIFFENETGKTKDIIKESCRKMKGGGGKIRKLRQSLFLPFLSCIFLIPIPFVITNYEYELSKKAYELMKINY